MTLVETHPGESDDDFRAAMDAALQAIVPERPKWWHPYEVRATFEYDGIRFRHFFCIAGSVEGWVWKIACDGGLRRVILLTDEAATVFGPIRMYGRGADVVIDPSDIRPVGPAV